MQNPGDGFCIFQLRDSAAELRFMNMDYLREHNLTPTPENYEAVYSGSLQGNASVEEQLEQLYKKIIY